MPFKNIRTIPNDRMYQATITYVRWWLNIDRPILGIIGEKNGLAVDSYDIIVHQYNLGWGMPISSAKDKKSNVERIVDLFNSERLVFSHISSMKNKSIFCRDIAIRMRSDCYGTYQLSAATKLFWFLAGEDWTMFDSYAASGAGVKDSWVDLGKAPDKKTRMEQFYERLSDPFVVGTVRDLQRVIQGAPRWSAVNPWRVLDAFLMFNGGFKDLLYSDDANSQFVESLPTDIGTSLRDMAHAINEAWLARLKVYLAAEQG